MKSVHSPTLARSRKRWLVLSVALATAATMTMFGAAASAQTAVGLGTAGSYAILAGATITNTGPSTINGNIGLSPGTAITGMDEATVNGATNATNGAAEEAQADLLTAYNQADSQPPIDSVDYAQLGDREPLTSGTYHADSSMNLTGTVTLDGGGRSDAVFIFQAESTLVTGSNSRVELVNGANPCNVFWQVGSSATLGTGTSFVGTVMTAADISVQANATVQGRLLAQTAGAVTLINDTINIAPCGVPTVPTTPASTPPTTPPTDATTPTTSPTDSTAPTTPTTPTTTETEPSTSVPTTPTTTVTNGIPVIPIPIPIPILPPGGNTPGGPDQPPVVDGQPPVGGGQPPSGGGQPPSGPGQPPVAEGQPPVIAGQPPVEGGRPPVIAGQPPAGGGYIVPKGYPDTGAGGTAAGSSPLKANALVAALVALTLLGSGIAAGQAFRLNRRLK